MCGCVERCLGMCKVCGECENLWVCEKQSGCVNKCLVVSEACLGVSEQNIWVCEQCLVFRKCKNHKSFDTTPCVNKCLWCVNKCPRFVHTHKHFLTYPSISSHTQQTHPPHICSHSSNMSSRTHTLHASEHFLHIRTLSTHPHISSHKAEHLVTSPNIVYKPKHFFTTSEICASCILKSECREEPIWGNRFVSFFRVRMSNAKISICFSRASRGGTWQF